MLQELQTVLLGYWHQLVAALPRLLLAAVLLGIIWAIASRVRIYLDHRLLAESDDPLLARFLTKLARWVVLLIGILISLQIVGFSGIVSGIVAGAGVSAVVVGFAFKDIAENFLAGVILAFNRPFNLRDTISIQEVMGRVESLDLRTTLVKTFDGKDVYIPNATVLKEKVTNYTRDGYLRQDFVVGIDFDDSVAGATKLILEQIRQLPEILNTEPHTPFVIINELATSTVNLKVFFWTTTDDYRRGVLELRSEVMDRTKTVLAANGYSLPPDIIEVRLPSSKVALPIELRLAPGQAPLVLPTADPKTPPPAPKAAPAPAA
ncbi:mechanosensitive ion channel family protein [Hymenobacter coccineus]|uniref:Mechanosensitive ion channel protein MscS n=1 Tax=Hymenobacter coccineus TaxID=1908235 RepID=A0A1G1TJS0_9BACT|nr:mechanosensitive ion channel family protein [Hymenobacter coccineus]OGX91135.1 hypothetical protein BEN49_20955 [Hymenobacter coccineus]